MGVFGMVSCWEKEEVKGIKREDWGQRYEQGGGSEEATRVSEKQKPSGKWRREKNTGTPSVKTNIKGRNETRLALLGRTPQRSNWCAGQSLEIRGKSVLKVSDPSTSGMVFSYGYCWLPPKFDGKPDLGGSLALRGSDGQCVGRSRRLRPTMRQYFASRLCNDAVSANRGDLLVGELAGVLGRCTLSAKGCPNVLLPSCATLSAEG